MSATAAPQLVPLEQKTLALLTEHLSNRQIADRMQISERAVRRLVSGLLAKLERPNRRVAAARARRERLHLPPAAAVPAHPAPARSVRAQDVWAQDVRTPVARAEEEASQTLWQLFALTGWGGVPESQGCPTTPGGPAAKTCRWGLRHSGPC